MKKRFLVGATVLALILSVSLLLFSVYAAVNQTLSVRNTISFAGGAEGLKFTIDGRVTGARRAGSNESEDDISTFWEYDYDRDGILPPHEWEIGDIVFDSDDKELEDIHITYTFVINNLSSYTYINARIEGPENIEEGLIKTTYAYEQDSSVQEGTQLNISRTKPGILQLKLTLEQIEDYSCKAEIKFNIILSIPNQS